MRALLFMALVLILFGVIMLVTTRLRRRQDSQTTDDTPVGEKTVRCVECGAFIPASRATRTDHGPICPEHQS